MRIRIRPEDELWIDEGIGHLAQYLKKIGIDELHMEGNEVTWKPHDNELVAPFELDEFMKEVAYLNKAYNFASEN